MSDQLSSQTDLSESSQTDLSESSGVCFHCFIIIVKVKMFRYVCLSLSIHKKEKFVFYTESVQRSNSWFDGNAPPPSEDH